jgi:hypothetical protein
MAKATEASASEIRIMYTVSLIPVSLNKQGLGCKRIDLVLKSTFPFYFIKVNIRVKLSLCLMKYHIVRTYMLNYIPYHDYVLGTGGTAPLILTLSKRWR